MCTLLNNSMFYILFDRRRQLIRLENGGAYRIENIQKRNQYGICNSSTIGLLTTAYQRDDTLNSSQYTAALRAYSPHYFKCPGIHNTRLLMSARYWFITCLAMVHLSICQSFDLNFFVNLNLYWDGHCPPCRCNAF